MSTLIFFCLSIDRRVDLGRIMDTFSASSLRLRGTTPKKSSEQFFTKDKRVARC